jgi:phosphatidate phosphatase APP1
VQIYAQIARRYQGRIAHIYIRNVQNKHVGHAMSAAETRARLQKQFRGLADESWTVFETPKEIEAGAASWPW